MIRMAALVIALVLFGVINTTQANYKGFERGDVLVTAQELKTLLDTKNPKLVLIAVANVFDYRTGHITGARKVWRNDYSAVMGRDYPYEGMIAKREQFQQFARGVGVSNESIVVVYDHEYDATHLWWAFYLYGKKDVRVLDGGYEAWVKHGYDTQYLAPGAPTVGNFVAEHPLEGWSIDEAYIKAGHQAGTMQLWDTRERSEWSGEELMTDAFRRGRIPFAKFINWREFRGKDGTFLPADEMTAMLLGYGFDKAKDQVFYCQAGVRTTQEIMGLYLLGWPLNKLHNYAGSWIAWSYDKDNPIVCDRC